MLLRGTHSSHSMPHLALKLHIILTWKLHSFYLSSLQRLKWPNTNSKSRLWLKQLSGRSWIWYIRRQIPLQLWDVKIKCVWVQDTMMRQTGRYSHFLRTKHKEMHNWFHVSLQLNNVECVKSSDSRIIFKYMYPHPGTQLPSTQAALHLRLGLA